MLSYFRIETWSGSHPPSGVSRGFQSKGRAAWTFDILGERLQASDTIIQSPDEGSVNTKCLKVALEHIPLVDINSIKLILITNINFAPSHLATMRKADVSL